MSSDGQDSSERGRLKTCAGEIREIHMPRFEGLIPSDPHAILDKRKGVDVMLDQKDLQALAQLINTALEPLRKDISEIKERVTKIEVVQENVTDKNIQLLFEGQQGMTDKFRKLDRIEMTLNAVKSDTEVIKDVVTEHSKSIRELKAIK